MPSNPIQRKTRNAFLIGMFVMLIIAVIAIVLLYFTLFKDTIVDSRTKGNKGTAYAYKLISSVKSGEEISMQKVKLEELYVDDLPADYINANTPVAGFKSKLDIQAGTILSESLLYTETAVNNSTRLMEYNMLTLPSTLAVGEYVDVRFMMPNGEDYIVLAKKRVEDIKNTTIAFYLTEDEILMMSSAIIESYVIKASNLYINKYVQAGTQNSSTPTYSVSSAVYQLIQSNSQKNINIEDYAKINASYNGELRRTIEEELAKYTGYEITNVEDGMKSQKENAMSLYLSGLAGY